MEEETTFDVIIVGGGTAGCATALSLMQSSPKASFLLIDDAYSTSFKIGESLPPEAKRFLHYLSPSILDRLSQDTAKGVHTTCTGNASVWESPDLHETYAIMNPFGSGWHLDRAAFDEILREHVRFVCDTAVVRRNMLVKGKFVAVRKGENGWIVTAGESELNVKTDYRSRWLVDASGRKACVARKLGAKTVKLDRLLAFYAVFHSHSHDLDHRTLIEATESGWWYTSQLAHHKRVVVFHTDDRDPSSKFVRKQEGFLDTLRNTTHISQTIENNDYCLISDDGMNYPRCTAANSSFLEPFGDESDQWCAVGDAAMAFDPLSSQGIITALRMGCSVGIMLSKQVQHSGSSKEAVEPMDLNSVKTLYEAARRDYGQKRAYFYKQSMFSSDFWQRRK